MRYFAPITKAELKNKIIETYRTNPDSDYEDFEPGEDFTSGLQMFYQVLTSTIEKDLKKVGFDQENVNDNEKDAHTYADIVGYHTLSNGLTYLGIEAGGDWEIPVFYIIYWDGKNLRAYIPKEGNLWNTDTKEAYGNDCWGDSDREKDVKNYNKRFPKYNITDWEDMLNRVKSDCNAIINDIQNRIYLKNT